MQMNAIEVLALPQNSLLKLPCSHVLVHWENLGGEGGEGGGRADRDGEYMYIHGWFMSMYDKNHYNIVK